MKNDIIHTDKILGVPFVIRQNDDFVDNYPFFQDEVYGSGELVCCLETESYHWSQVDGSQPLSSIWNEVGDNFVENHVAEVAGFLGREMPDSVDEDFIAQLRDDFHEFETCYNNHNELDSLRFALETCKTPHMIETIKCDASAVKWTVVIALPKKYFENTKADNTGDLNFEHMKSCLREIESVFHGHVFTCTVGNEDFGNIYANPDFDLVDLKRLDLYQEIEAACKEISDRKTGRILISGNGIELYSDCPDEAAAISSMFNESDNVKVIDTADKSKQR